MNSFSTFAYYDLFSSVGILVIGVQGNIGSALTRYAIYHECGHHMNGDLSFYLNRDLKLFKITNLAVKVGLDKGLDLLMGILSCGLSYNLISKKVPSIGRMGLAGIIGFATPFIMSKIYNKTIGMLYSRQRENEADIFAVRVLLAQNDLEPIFKEFLYFAYSLDFDKTNGSNEIWFLQDHPGDYQRAELILKELKKANINLKNIPFNLKEADKIAFQKKVTEQIAKHFPQFLN